MKKIFLILFLITVGATADSPKYDFTMTVTVNQKTLKEMQSIMKDFEEVAQKYDCKIDFKINQERENNGTWYFGGSDTLPFKILPYKKYANQYIDCSPKNKIDYIKLFEVIDSVTDAL